jgi:hypothetical protein
MLEQCKNNLKDYLEKVYLSIGQNESLTVIQEKADIFIEGWSFGHTIVEHNNDIQSTVFVQRNMPKNNNAYKVDSDNKACL